MRNGRRPALHLFLGGRRHERDVTPDGPQGRAPALVDSCLERAGLQQEARGYRAATRRRPREQRAGYAVGSSAEAEGYGAGAEEGGHETLRSDPGGKVEGGHAVAQILQAGARHDEHLRDGEASSPGASSRLVALRASLLGGGGRRQWGLLHVPYDLQQAGIAAVGKDGVS